MMKRLALVPILFLFTFATGHAAETVEPMAFLYFARWDPDLGDVDATSVQRIKLTNTQYQEARSKFTTAFVAAASAPPAAPVVAPVGVPGGAAVPTAPRGEVRLSLDPRVPAAETPLVLQFDLTSTQQAIAEGNLPETLAEWTFYYWQVKLWEMYVAMGTLQLPAPLTLSDVDRYAGIIGSTREPVWVWTEIDPEDQEPSEWVQSTEAFRELPDPTAEEVPVIDFLRASAEAMGGQVAIPQIPTEADREKLGMKRIFDEAAYAMDAKKHDQYWSIMNRIRQRQEERDRYAEWIGDRRDILKEFAQDWAKKYDGSQFNVDGVQFLVSEKKPLEGVPANVRNIVVDENVVPYDILNEDGTLKRPEPLED